MMNRARWCRRSSITATRFIRWIPALIGWQAKGCDFNVDARRYPAWSYDGSSWNGPEDDGLASLLLATGADPYRWYLGQERSALASVIDRCRVEVLDLMLAKPPRKLDALTREGLDAALEATTREPWSGLNCLQTS